MNTLSAPDNLSEAFEYSSPVPFSRGVVVDLPGFKLISLSGTASVGAKGESLHEGDFLAQAERMLSNVSALLASGGASWRDVFKTTFYLKDMAYYQELSGIRARFFAERDITVFPASTCVQAVLCRPELLCEMEVMAIVKSG